MNIAFIWEVNENGLMFRSLIYTDTGRALGGGISNALPVTFRNTAEYLWRFCGAHRG